MEKLVRRDLIPDKEEGVSILMLRPDVFSKPTITTIAAQDILIGLGDVLTGTNNYEFYKSSYVARITDWALDKWGIPKEPNEPQRAKSIMGIESLRAKYADVNGRTSIELEEFIYSVLEVTGYSILSEVECKFDDEWIKRLYPYLQDDEPDPFLGEITKSQIREALKQGSLRFLFLEGPMGYDFIDIFRFFLRKTFRDYTQDLIDPINSIAHIPDFGKEKDMTFQLLRDYFENGAKT